MIQSYVFNLTRLFDNSKGTKVKFSNVSALSVQLEISISLVKNGSVTLSSLAARVNLLIKSRVIERIKMYVGYSTTIYAYFLGKNRNRSAVIY